MTFVISPQFKTCDCLNLQQRIEWGKTRWTCFFS